MKKIVEVLECGGPGGTGEQVAAICNGLDPARFEVTLAFAARGANPDEFRRACAGARRAEHLPEMTREISPARDAAAFRRLKKLFREIKPDVVHAHSSKAGVLARAAAKAARVPRILYSPRGYSFLMQDRSRVQRELFRLIEKGAAAVGETVAVSPSEAELAHGLGARRVTVVRDGYLGDFTEPLPHEHLVVGSCGRMTFARNPEAWVLLSQRLLDSRMGVRSVWIGGGEQEALVRKELTDMNLNGKAEVTGWVTAAEARERLRKIDVFAHASRWDALPNAVLEAMAAGLPVVATDVPGNRDCVVDGVTGFLVRTELEMLERCQRLLGDEALRRRLGAAGRDRVRTEFSRERMLTELSAVYER